MPSVRASSIVVEMRKPCSFASSRLRSFFDLLDVDAGDAEVGEVVLVADHVAVEEAAGDVVGVRQVPVHAEHTTATFFAAGLVRFGGRVRGESAVPIGGVGHGERRRGTRGGCACGSSWRRHEPRNAARWIARPLTRSRLADSILQSIHGRSACGSIYTSCQTSPLPGHCPMHRLAPASLVCFSVDLPSAEDWPGWRGPRSDGTVTDTGFPLTWSATENVKWKTATARHRPLVADREQGEGLRHGVRRGREEARAVLRRPHDRQDPLGEDRGRLRPGEEAQREQLGQFHARRRRRTRLHHLPRQAADCASTATTSPAT